MMLGYVDSGTLGGPLATKKNRLYVCSLRKQGSLDKLRMIHGRADILILTLSLVEDYKESRQKRLVAHKKYNLKTAILQYPIDTAAAANTTRLHSFDVKGHASGRTINGKSHH